MKRLSRILSVILCFSILLSCSFVYAASTGSSAEDKSVGADSAQNATTVYENVSVGKSKTNTYLTVDDEQIVVGVPTIVILSGTADVNGNYSADYTVSAQGDMAGDKVLNIYPETDKCILSQSGKTSVDADITQVQTEFSAVETADGVSSTGKISANGLTAGSWNGNFNFVIDMKVRYEYYSSVELAVADANNLTTENADVLRTDVDRAEAGLFIDNDRAYLKLMNNANVESEIDFNVPVSFNLNNYTLTCNSLAQASGSNKGLWFNEIADVYNGDLIVNSTVSSCYFLKGGTLLGVDLSGETTSTSTYVCVFAKAGDLSVYGSTIDYTGASNTVGIRSGTGVNTTIDNTFVVINALTKNAYGFYQNQGAGTTNVTDSYFKGHSVSGAALGFYRSTPSTNNDYFTCNLVNSEFYAISDVCTSTNAASFTNTDLFVDGCTFSIDGSVLSPLTPSDVSVEDFSFNTLSSYDASGNGIYAKNVNGIFKEDTGPIVVRGGNVGFAMFGDSNISIYGGDYASPEHGGFYNAGSSNSTLNIYGGKFWNNMTEIKDYVDMYDGISVGTSKELYGVIAFGGFYCYSNAGEVNISNAEISGGFNGLRIKWHDGNTCVTTIRDTDVNSTRYAISIDAGTLNLNGTVNTSYGSSEFYTEYDHSPVINDNRTNS